MAALNFDPFSPEVLANPYPYYHILREQAPIYYDGARDQWVFSRYHDVANALQQPDCYLIEVTDLLDPSGFNGVDSVAHSRMRRAVGRCFTQQRIAALEPFIESTARLLLDQARSRGTFDFVDDFSSWLPIAVLARLMGVEDESWSHIKQWSQAIVNYGIGILHGHSDETDIGFHPFFSEQLTKNFRTPGDNIISTLLWSADSKDRLSPHEILSVIRLLHVAATETTVNLLGNVALTLLCRPDLVTVLQEDVKLLPLFVEESLRYDPPVQLVSRITGHDTTVADHCLPAGSRVILHLGAANRDPALFEQPDTFIMERTFRQHLSFSRGVHTCLGAHLARREAHLVLKVILDHIDQWSPLETLADLNLNKYGDGILHGPSKLLISCSDSQSKTI